MSPSSINTQNFDNEASNKIEQEITTDPEIINALISGRRPEGMDFDTYKIMRKSVQKFLKRRKQGKLIKYG